MHAHGGVDMLRAGVQGLEEGAHNAGLEPPQSLAITVLTSDGDAPPHIMPKRVMLAAEAGCSGIVCAVGDLEEAHHYVRLTRVTPGIRLSGDNADDQARAASPGDALAGGSDLLVVGRAVTAPTTRSQPRRRSARRQRRRADGPPGTLPGWPPRPSPTMPGAALAKAAEGSRVRANLKQALKAGELARRRLGPGRVRRGSRHDQDPHDPRGIARRREGEVPPHDGIHRHLRESPESRASAPSKRRALLTAFGGEVATSNDD